MRNRNANQNLEREKNLLKRNAGTPRQKRNRKIQKKKVSSMKCKLGKRFFIFYPFKRVYYYFMVLWNFVNLNFKLLDCWGMNTNLEPKIWKAEFKTVLTVSTTALINNLLSCYIPGILI